MYKNILIPIDLKHESSWQRALPIALVEARHSGAQLHVVTVIPAVDMLLTAVHLPKDFNRKQREQASHQLAELVKKEVPDDISVRQTVKEGSVYREILHEADDVNADLIVMASHRPELKDYLLGLNAARIVRHADCSVLVVR